MNLTPLDLVLWISGYAGYICLLAALCLKKKYVLFPWFTALVAEEMLTDGLLALICRYGTHHQYFVAYWTFDIVDSVLTVAVVYEVLKHLIRFVLIKNLIDLRELRWFSLAMLVLSGILCWKFSPHLAKPLANIALRIDAFSSMLLLGLTGVVFLTVFFYGVRFSVHASVIAYGLSFYALGRVPRFASVFAFGGADFWATLDTCATAAYVMVLFVWAIVFWREEPQRKLTHEMNTLLSQAHALLK